MAPTTRKRKKTKVKPEPISDTEEEPSGSEPEEKPVAITPKRKKKSSRRAKPYKNKKNSSRLNESPEQKARRLHREKERVRRRRANETPEERERRLKVARESRKRRYKMLKETETPEEREERMRVESDVRWLQRKCETEEQRRARQRRDADRQREIRRRRYGMDRPLDWNGLRVPEPESTRKGSSRPRPKIACPVCSVMVLEDYMETHSLRHQGSSARPFRCSVCPKTYIQFSHLKEHRRRHFDTAPLEENDFYCEICSTIIYTRVRYVTHLKYHIRKSGLQLAENEPIFLYICDFDGCQLCFRDKGRFISHLESHCPGRSAFTCSTCNKPFAQETHCKTHMELVHTSGSDNIIDCPHCHLVIENKAEDWEWHHKSHQIRLDEKPPGNHLCEGCGKTFRTAKSLVLHVRRMHETAPPLDRKPHSSKPESKLVENKSIFPCAVCGKYLSRKPELHNHMLRHHTYEHGTRCYVCDKRYEHLHTLLIHIRGMHTNEPKLTKRASCHYCDRDFSGYTMKNKHHFFAHREVYLKTKPFCCAVCYRNFAAVETLTSHLLVHEKWKCPVCSLCQISQKMHDMHLRSHNLGPLAIDKQREIKPRRRPKSRRGAEFYALEHQARDRLGEVDGNYFYQGEVGHVEIQVPAQASRGREDEYVPNAPVDYSQQWTIATEEVFDGTVTVEGYESTQPDAVYSQDMVEEAQAEQAAEAEKASKAAAEAVSLFPESQAEAQATESEAMPPPNAGLVVVHKKYKCDRCPRQFTFPKHLFTHIAWHVGDETGNVEMMSMSAESIVFTEQSDMDLDKYRNPDFVDADGVAAKRYVCTECAESFSHRTNLSKHRRIIHGVLVTEPEKQYKCEFCPRTFSRESNLVRHVNVVHKEREEPPADTLDLEVDVKPFSEEGPPTPWEWGVSQADDHHSDDPDDGPADFNHGEDDSEQEDTFTNDSYPEPPKKSVGRYSKQEEVPKKSMKSTKERNRQENKIKSINVSSSKPAFVPVSSTSDPRYSNKFKCDECLLSFTREVSLRQHKLTHEAARTFVEEEGSEWILPDIKTEPQDESDMDWDGGDDEDMEFSDPEPRIRVRVRRGEPILRFEELPSINELKIRIAESLAALTPGLREQAQSLPQLYIKLPVVEIPVKKGIPPDQKPIAFQFSNAKKSIKKHKKKKKSRGPRKPRKSRAKPRPPKVAKPPRPPADPNAPKKKEGKRNVCNVCGKDFHPHTDMRVHMSTHTGEQPYKCKDCLKHFKNQRQYREHRKKHHSTAPPTKRDLFDSSEFYCDVCYITIKYKRRYDRHMRTHQDLEPSLKSLIRMYQCDACPMAYRLKPQFVIHLESHAPDTAKVAAVCSVCSKSFAKAETLEAHMKNVHEAEGTVYDCEYCHLNFTSAEDFKKHEQAHAIDLTANLVGEHMCFQCGMTFLHIATLNGHIIQVHEGEGLDPRAKARVHLRKEQGGKVSHNEKAPCQVCGKMYGVRTALKNHMLKEHTYEHGLICFVCNRKFACLGPLTRHLLDFHKDVRSSANYSIPARLKTKRTKYPCPYCPVVYSGETLRLQKHCFTEHNEEYMQNKPFYCELCYKNFDNENEYHAHRPSHDKFKCIHCGKQFLRQDYLNVHMLRHEGEREFECTVCDKKFTTVYNLRDHEKRHTKEYAYFCTYCPNTVGFYKKVHLDKHMEKTHASETMEMEIDYSEVNSNSNSSESSGSSEETPQYQPIIQHQPQATIITQPVRILQHPIPIPLIHPHQYLLDRHLNPQHQHPPEELHFTMDSFLY